MRSRNYSPTTGRFLTKDVWNGDYTRPLSLNKWNYVEGNPVNYTDPSGYIKQGSEAEDANEIYNRLLYIYNVQIEKDWGTRSYLLNPFECYWEEGNWDIQELEYLEDAVQDIASTFGDIPWRGENFKAAMKSRVYITRPKSIITGDRAYAPYQVFGPFIGDIILPDKTFSSSEERAKKSIAHEFGHVWDTRNFSSLSKNMGILVQTLTRKCVRTACYYVFDASTSIEEAPGRIKNNYAETNQYEDFAESFASIVYPTYYSGTGERNLIQGGLRETYIQTLINNLP